MEALMVFGLVAAGFVAVALALKASLWILLLVALPLFWLWMLIDAIARRDVDYPSKSTNEKVLWIVLLLFVHVSAVVYWFVVWRAARSRDAMSATPVPPSVPPGPQAGIVPAPQPLASTPPPAV